MADIPRSGDTVVMPVLHNPEIHGEGTICPTCRKVNPRPWRNDLIVTLRKLGLWKHGDAEMGGVMLCGECEEATERAYRTKFHPPDPLTWAATEIPSEYAEATWANYQDRGKRLTTAIEAVKAWPSSPQLMLYLYGGVGSGKTRLACTVARHHFETLSKSVLFVRAVDLFDRLRAIEVRDEQDAGVERLSTHRLVVIDDLGAEKPTEYTITKLLQVIERRQASGLRTVITTNLDLDELSERLQGDNRIPSRIADWALVLPLRADDYRSARAKHRHQQRLGGIAEGGRV